jgi:hypothetical protein
MIERDHSGSISSREMKQVFRALEIQASDTEIQQIIKQMDTDGNNEISFEEFARVNYLNYCYNLNALEFLIKIVYYIDYVFSGVLELSITRN